MASEITTISVAKPVKAELDEQRGDMSWGDYLQGVANDGEVEVQEQPTQVDPEAIAKAIADELEEREGIDDGRATQLLPMLDKLEEDNTEIAAILKDIRTDLDTLNSEMRAIQ